MPSAYLHHHLSPVAVCRVVYVTPKFIHFISFIYSVKSSWQNATVQ